jgi:hypothetical protein
MTIGLGGALEAFGDFWAEGDGEVWFNQGSGKEREDAQKTGQGAIYATNPWDTLWLGGEQLPGICRVKCEPTIQIDTKKHKGADGANITLLGYLPGPVQVDVEIWTSAQWATLKRLLKELIWRKPGKADAIAGEAMRIGFTREQAMLFASALEIRHPSLKPLGVENVVVTGVSTLEDGRATDSKVMRIKCIQYSPPSTVSPRRPRQKGPGVHKDVRKDKPRNDTPAKPSASLPGPSGRLFTPASGSD